MIVSWPLREPRSNATDPRSCIFSVPSAVVIHTWARGPAASLVCGAGLARTVAVVTVAARTPAKPAIPARRAAKNDDGSVAILTLFLNPSENDRVFRLPAQNVATRMLIDSAEPDKDESDITAEEITVVARSAVLTKSVIETPS